MEDSGILLVITLRVIHIPAIILAFIGVWLLVGAYQSRRDSSDELDAPMSGTRKAVLGVIFSVLAGWIIF